MNQEPNNLKQNVPATVAMGAGIGLAAGLLLFFVPGTIIEEGSRVTLSLILILLGPRLIMDKLRLDFSKGRLAMAGTLAAVLIVYTLTGHPVH